MLENKWDGNGYGGSRKASGNRIGKEVRWVVGEGLEEVRR
jgi:hypothetical protein